MSPISSFPRAFWSASRQCLSRPTSFAHHTSVGFAGGFHSLSPRAVNTCLRAGFSCPSKLLARPGFRNSMVRATYEGPPGQDVKEPFQVCQPPSDGHGGFIEEADVVLKGFSKARGDVHREGDWHRSVHIWVVHPPSKQLLLQQRSMNKDTHPGLWDVSAAGHITGDDEVGATAIRELEEELGLEGHAVESLALLFVAIADNTTATIKDREYQWVYLLEVLDAERLTKVEFGESEVAAVKLVPIPDYHRGLVEGDLALVPRPPHYRDRFFTLLRERYGPL